MSIRIGDAHPNVHKCSLWDLRTCGSMRPPSIASRSPRIGVAACWRELNPPTASNKLVRLATAPIMTATQFPPRQGRTGADRCWPGDCVAISRRANVGGDVRRVAHSERGRGLMNRLARTLLVGAVVAAALCWAGNRADAQGGHHGGGHHASYHGGYGGS